jgi:hypothetical protein
VKAANETTLEFGSSYPAMPIFTMQSLESEALEMVLVSIVDVSFVGPEGHELNPIKPGSEFDRFKPRLSEP